VIRGYRPADLEEVLGVWGSASALAHPFLSREFLEQERRNIAGVYLPKAKTWVWDDGGHVVGFISLLGNEVGGLFVDPKHHRSGIGRVLVECARAARGELEAEVFERNQLGRAFYAALGFQVLYRQVDSETGFEIQRLRLAAKKPPQPSDPGRRAPR
jgi:putative acetyltransferase